MVKPKATRDANLFENDGLCDMDQCRHAKEHAKGKVGSEARVEEVVGVASVDRNTAILVRHRSGAAGRR